MLVKIKRDKKGLCFENPEGASCRTVTLPEVFKLLELVELPALGWGIPRDLGMETGVGGINGGEGL